MRQAGSMATRVDARMGTGLSMSAWAHAEHAHGRVACRRATGLAAERGGAPVRRGRVDGQKTRRHYRARVSSSLAKIALTMYSRHASALLPKRLARLPAHMKSPVHPTYEYSRGGSLARPSGLLVRSYFLHCNSGTVRKYGTCISPRVSPGDVIYASPDVTPRGKKPVWLYGTPIWLAILAVMYLYEY